MSLPYLTTDNKDIDKAYRLALATLTCNTVNTKNEKTGAFEPLLNAGMYYGTPWVRDTSINTWNGAGLLIPDVTKNTLMSLIAPIDGGDTISESTGQSWDVIIWVIGAWYQYLYTGDAEFLKSAYKVAENNIAYYEKNEFDEDLNLFRGPACYGDGVAAYPDIYARPGKSAILAFADYEKDLCIKKGIGIPMFTLSTNCLYYYAYVIADKMAQILQKDVKYKAKAERLRSAINEIFWSEKKGSYIYIKDSFGSCDFDETLGVSFAVLFGIADEEKCRKIFKNHPKTQHGVPCLWPSFERYRKGGNDFGRHSGTVWPFIQGFFADAAAMCERVDIFDRELLAQTKNALGSLQFAEIYHPNTGEVYGGLQEDFGKIREWDSQPHQTWSATAYLRNIFMNIFGMRFNESGVEFKPCGTSIISDARLVGLNYRNCILDIHIKGKGSRFIKFLIDGKESLPFIPSNLTGAVKIEIVFET